MNPDPSPVASQVPVSGPQPTSENRRAPAGVGAWALAVHVFLPAQGVHAEASYARLRELWAGCAGHLGTTAAFPQLALPAELPQSLAEASRIGPLAARRSDDAGGIVQALMIREHDVFCLAVMIAPDPAEGVGWSELEARWSAVAGASADPVLGEARLFLALLGDGTKEAAVSGRRRPHRDGCAAPPGVRAAMPQHPDTDADWWRRGHRTGSSLLVWEASARPDERALRRFAVLAHRSSEKLLDAWVWTRGEVELPPFGRYLMHMARIRYELRVYARGEAVRRLRAEADSRVERMLELLERNIPAGPAELVAASTRLTVLRVKSAGLIAALTGLREMRRTVQIATSNMTAALGDDAVQAPPGGVRGASALADDRALADWFVTQLEDDALYVEAACDRTRDVAEIAATVTEHGLQERREASDSRRDRFSLLQTAIIGAVVMVLTAVQALGYQVPLPGPAKAPLIAVLGAVTLLLAVVVLRLATAPGRSPQAWLSHACAGLTAAALVWLLVASLWSATAHHAAPPVLTAALSGFGFIIGSAVAYLFYGRRPAP